MTRPSKPTPPVQLEPASACPSKITVCPWHGPPPSTTPTALNLSANGAGIWVSPGSKAMVPVGFAGVPPQVHLVAACVEVTPPARTKALATAHALAPTIARNRSETAAWFECSQPLIPCSLRESCSNGDNVSVSLRKCQLAMILRPELG